MVSGISLNLARLIAAIIIPVGLRSNNNAGQPTKGGRRAEARARHLLTLLSIFLTCSIT